MRRWMMGVAVLLAIKNPISAVSGGGAFLEKSQDPTVIALGGACASLSGQATLYSNPASLAKGRGQAIQATGYTAFETNFFGFSYTGAFDFFALGVGYVGAETAGASRVDYAETQGKYALTGDTFGSSAQALYVSGAFSPYPNLYAGVSVKGVSESIDGANAHGLGADVGILADIPILGVALGATVQNMIAPQLQWQGADSTYDRYYALGISKTVLNTVLITADIHKKSGSDYTYHAGVAWYVSPQLPLRAGYNNGNISFGTSLELTSLTLSYAMVLPKSSESYLDQTSFFAVEYRFN